MHKLDFSIGILSWKGYDSLLNSLISYEKNGLSNLTNRKYVCLPEYTKEGVSIAKKFNYEPILIRENIGILGGFKILAEKMPKGPLLLLENDLQLIEGRKETFNQLNQSIKLLYKNKISQIRLRSIKEPGEPFHGIDKYNRYWEENFFSKFRRTFRPFKARKLIGTSVYVEEKPHLKHPKYIFYMSKGFYSLSTKVINWSNLAILVDKNFFLNVIIKEAENTERKNKVNGFKNIEIELNKPWWREQNWKIIISPGLFSHVRLSDRGY